MPEPSSPPERRLLIRADMREKSSRVVAFLGELPDVELEFAALPSADYVLSDAVAVERKEAGDFAASIMDRRLFGQAAKMKAEFERPVFLIEGDLSAIRSAIHPDALRGALSFLVVLEGITVLQTSSAEETAALLRTLARHAQEGLGYTVNLRGSKPRGASLYAEYLVEGLPGVGRRRARQLLEHFGTPAAVMRASPEELGQVPGIGEKSARQIWDALNTPYEPAAEGPA
ncbi:MAG TPA: ERCC4 domain-containing protein [Longimicrobiaceae bacterium]|nr:ERCC4 domain-containing protein [Longimicrobiaceae bacterium]